MCYKNFKTKKISPETRSAHPKAAECKRKEIRKILEMTLSKKKSAAEEKLSPKRHSI